MEELINKIKHQDTCTKNDFAEILANSNPTIGNKDFFCKCIFEAQEAKKLTPIDKYAPTANYITGRSSMPTEQYNFKYHKENLIDWANQKKFSLPEELSTKNRKNDGLLLETEKNTLYKMILAMAMSKYGYNPQDNRNTATGANKGSIKFDIENRLNYEIDEETIRKHLKNAAAELLSAK